MRLWRWFYPGLNIKRWIFMFSIGLILVIFGITMMFNYQFFGVVEEWLFRVVFEMTGRYNYAVLVAVGAVVTVIGAVLMVMGFRLLMRRILDSIAPDRTGALGHLLLERARRDRGPSVVAIGGGTGLSTLLRGMKKRTSHLTAIVTVADDGGSSGRLREEMGIIAPGDLRNCLVAMAEKETLMDEVFQHRFGGTGTLAGHSMGNLFLAALMERYRDPETALEAASEILNVRGKVVPSSTARLRLRAEMEDGTVVDGESRIPRTGKRIRRLHVLPENPTAVAAAIEAMAQADIITLGPGSLYTSVLPNLLVPEMALALQRSDAIKIYICNAMTQPGETDGYTVADHVRAIFDHVGPGVVDYVLINDRLPEPEVLERYRQLGSVPVEADTDALKRLGVKYIRANVLASGEAAAHDPDLLAAALIDAAYAVQSDLHPQLLDYYFESAH